MLRYWKDHALRWCLLGGCAAIFALVLYLYELPVAAAGYAALLCGVLLALAGLLGGLHTAKKHRQLREAQNSVGITLDSLPPADTQLEEDYQQLLRVLSAEKAGAVLAVDEAQSELVDYFTLWAHQIKTPIAAMDLILQTQDFPESGSLKQSLFQIQQYVEMVLCYLRLDSETTDFVIRTCPLDPIIRTALREFAPSFIRKNLQLHYDPVSCSVLTDEKWLLFVLEQLLSNAVKYTPQGSVTIRLEEPQTLVIEDTGLGIAPEDLPRVFEKGYTGQRGRADQRSTGIGLYLCRRTLRQLGHTISIHSTPKEGTAVRIHLQRQSLPME